MTYVHIDSSGRIQSSVKKKEYSEPDSFEFDFPEDFDFSNQDDFRIVDGELIHDPIPMTEEQKKLEEEMERNRQLNRAIPMILQTISVNLTDDQILSVSLAFDEWNPDEKYKDGEIVRYKGFVYRVIANVNKNNTAEPDSKEGSLYYKLITISSEGVENWTTPDNKKSAYDKGDRVSHNEKVYESVKNNNMDEPGTSDSWIEIT